MNNQQSIPAVEAADQSPISVLHVSTETGWRGGEQQVKLLTDGLLARGHKPIVMSPPGAMLLKDREAAGIGVPLSYHGEFDVLAARHIADYVRRNNIQLIHAQTSHAHSLAWLAARRAGVPVVVARRVDFRVGGNWFSRRKYVSRRCTFIAISDGVQRVLIDSGISPDRISVVHSGVDPNRYDYRSGERDESAAESFGVKRGEQIVVNVAALTDHKDQITLLTAALDLRQRYKGFRLLIAGAGEMEAELKQFVSVNRMDYVTFLGHVENLAPLYRAADVFALSSHMEGLCTSIIDAMLAGVPVVATRVGGVPELVVDGRTGLLVKARSPQQLSLGLESMLLHPARGARMAAAARNHVLAGFTSDRMVEGTIQVYRRILAGQ